MASMPFLVFLSELPTGAVGGTWETDQERKFGGKQIVICGFRETTESFLQDLFSSKRNRAGI